jgi:hypothetical protein
VGAKARGSKTAVGVEPLRLVKNEVYLFGSRERQRSISLQPPSEPSDHSESLELRSSTRSAGMNLARTCAGRSVSLIKILAQVLASESL